ncbi:MAG: hypothetical protein C0412_06175 [Flavobacterium sp.]|nr:hypothetical protein [Flavobacterium sp.]
MKKIITITVLVLTLASCKKSNVELQIEQYELQKVKLEYLEKLMKVREDLSYKEQRRLVDSLITEEKTRLHNDSN